MRILLTIGVLVLVFSANLSAQKDFLTLDKQTYDYYIKGDYEKLKKTADTMISQGIDYYYLRMRLGILAYNRHLYSIASGNFTRALEFNSLDTISREYIYNSFLFSGRKYDAYLYLRSIPIDKKNITLRSYGNPVSSEFYFGSSVVGNDVVLYSTNSLNYEAVKSSFSINAGFQTYFLNRFRGTFAYTNYRKYGTVYSPSNSFGEDINFNQNQIYFKLTGPVIQGLDFSAFGHVAFYNEVITPGPPGNRRLTNQTSTEYLGGAGISTSGWKIRTGANVSFSNFSNSNQVRGEGYLTWLPLGNINFYLTSGGMYQTDINWGNTYQFNQEIGFKVLKFLWVESGVIKGNSFLYARNQGSAMNNSFQIPAITVYGNIIILPNKHISIVITPFYTENNIYFWDLNAFSRTNKLYINTIGCSIKLIYKFK